MNKDHKITCNNDEPARRKLCYISVVALFLAIFTCITPSGTEDLIKLNIINLVIAVVSLIRFKISKGKLRGKALAIAAITISLVHLLGLFITLYVKGLRVY